MKKDLSKTKVTPHSTKVGPKTFRIHLHSFLVQTKFFELSFLASGIFWWGGGWNKNSNHCMAQVYNTEYYHLGR